MPLSMSRGDHPPAHPGGKVLCPNQTAGTENNLHKKVWQEMRMKRRGRMGAEDGAAAVEMALVLPLLFLLIFGIIEFGFIFNRWITTTHAAREGVRLLALGDPDAESKAEASAPDVGFPIDCTDYSNPADPTLGTASDT